MTSHSTASQRWDRATYAGMAAVAVAAAILSFSALSGLAELVGITDRAAGFRLAWLLPISVDAYAVTATRVWLRTGVNQRIRTYACRNSIGAIGLSVAGNGIYHGLSAAGVTSMSGAGFGWLLVVAVSAVPPVMLGLVGHLHALISAAHQPATTTSTAPAAGGTAPDRVIAERDSPPALPAPAWAPKNGRSRPTGTASTRATTKTAGTGTASAGSGSPKSGSKGDAEAAMRAHWATERAAGRTPTGAELDRIAGTKDYGRKVRRTLLAENEQTPPAETLPTEPAVEADAADAA
jgi:hypothetical protein